MRNDDTGDLFEINKFKLDREWVRQPKMRREYALKLAEARRETKRARARLKVIRAEAWQEIRRRPDKFGIEGKATVDDLKHAIETHPRVVKAEVATINAEHDQDVSQAYVDTLDDRKPALQDLVRLFLSDYYAEPKAPAGADGDKVRKMERNATFSQRGKGGK